MSGSKAGSFNWWLPICGALAAVILVLPQLIFGNDALAIFGTIPLAFLIAVVLVAVALSKVRLYRFATIGMICVFLILAWSLIRSSDYLRTTTRWLVHSQSYKAQVLEQTEPADGNLKHVEWEGWGFPGAGNTTVYLVMDPTDGLAQAARNHSRGKFVGVPCAVAGVRRLQRHWYTVLFYTDTAWNSCA